PRIMAPSGTAGLMTQPGPAPRATADSPAAGGGCLPSGITVMPLDPKQRRAVVEWCDLYLMGCPVCQCRDYVFECVVAMPEVGPAGLSATRGVPVVPIVCRSCGYTILVSAAAMKLVPGMRPTVKAPRTPAAGQDPPEVEM